MHSTPETRLQKIAATYQSGCRRFDVAIHGIGGCPMAKDELTGNLSTESLIGFCEENKIETGLKSNELEASLLLANTVFSQVL